MGARNSERSEKDSRLSREGLGKKVKGLGPASGEIKPWAWNESSFAPTNFDDTAECWREEVGKVWTEEAEAKAAQNWLVAGAVACRTLTVGWVG